MGIPGVWMIKTAPANYYFPSQLMAFKQMKVLYFNLFSKFNEATLYFDVPVRTFKY